MANGRAAAWNDGDAAGAEGVGERTRAVAHQRGLLARLGEVDRDGEPLPAGECRDRPVQRLAHRVGRVG